MGGNSETGTPSGGVSSDENAARSKEGSLGYDNPSLFGKTSTLGNETVEEGEGRTAFKAISPIFTPVLSAISPVAGMMMGLANTAMSASDGNNNGVIGLGVGQLANVLGLSPAATFAAKTAAKSAGLGDGSYKGGDTTATPASPSTSGYAQSNALAPAPASSSVANASGTTNSPTASNAITSSISSTSPSFQVGGLSNLPGWFKADSGDWYDASDIAKRLAAKRAAVRRSMEGGSPV